MARVSFIISRCVLVLGFRALCGLTCVAARRVRGRANAPFCDQPSNHQLHSVHHRVRGLCDVLAKGIFETAIWTFLLGTHESANNRAFEASLHLIFR